MDNGEIVSLSPETSCGTPFLSMRTSFSFLTFNNPYCSYKNNLKIKKGVGIDHCHKKKVEIMHLSALLYLNG